MVLCPLVEILEKLIAVYVVQNEFSKLMFCAYRFSLKYFESSPSPFHDVTAYCQSSSSVKKRKFSSKKTGATHVTDLDIVACCYSLLHASSDYFRQRWNWSDFVELYVGHNDDFVRW